MTKRIYNLKRDTEDGRDFLFPSAGLKAALPKSLDLRSKCPSVYDQGSEGSCTAHAGCACRTMLAKNKKLDLSRAFLYYQARLLEGTTNEDSGASIRDTCKAALNYGICKSSYMPYAAGKYNLAPSATAVKKALKYKISAYKKITDLAGVKQAMYSRKQPVIIGMEVYQSMESKAVAKKGILPMPADGETKLGGHAVLVVGYKNAAKQGKFKTFLYKIIGKASSSGYLIIRNSWGSKWGIKGYFKMPYEYFEKYCFDFWIME